ncbi:signal peptidase I [Thermobifida cellulosilytica]|uniref:signal peptidase I n=1 Tax=Thermobifida cellulosilytica TaxID=144786 RepID=UPI001E54742E|nr:signal peptidase I [Thermobifida cellulosilytica]
MAEEPGSRRRGRSVVLRLLSALFQTAVAVLVLVALVIVVSVALLPRITGAQALIVLSGSMEPTLPVGSVVIARPVDPAEIEVGDVITFTHATPAQTEIADPAAVPLVTHRVIDVETTDDGLLFHTQGDANTVPDDPPVPASAVRGRLWYHIPYFGYAQQALVQGPTLLYALAGLLFVFGIWLLSVALGSDEPSESDKKQLTHPGTGEGGTS